MVALFWLSGAIFFGWQVCKLLLPDPLVLLGREDSFLASAWGLLFFRLTLAVCTGLLLSTWLTYLLAAAFASLLPRLVQPLLPANLLFILPISGWAAMAAWRQRRRRTSSWPSLARRVKERPFALLAAALAIWLLLALALMQGSFFRQGTHLLAGYSVFSDFAPHTALVSSFAKGYNWPTWYPHFANDGIAYHFMFFFLCGNLGYLGLPLDLAINLPSLIFLINFCLLLGFLAVRLTARPATFILAPLLLFFRSSMAFFTNLALLVQESKGQARRLLQILQALREQAVFIGSTPNDDWGLWGVNVYANQRHFLAGLSCLVLVLFLALPELESTADFKNWFSRDNWLLKKAGDRRRFYLAGLIMLLLPYWHGSALVALLLILFPLALLARARLGFLLLAVSSVLAAWLQVNLFQGTAERLGLTFQFGFIAADKTVPGVLLYLFLVTGLALPLLLLSCFFQKKINRLLLLAFLMPLLFTFFISLTPDVTVNHKFIIIFLAMGNIFLADLLVRMWQSRQKTLLNRTLAVLLSFCLTVTGLHELLIMQNIN